MGAALGNAAAFQHQDLIGVHDRRQAVCHHDYSVPAGKRRDDLADRGLACGIDVARSLVKHIDRRVVQQGAGHAHALALAARKVGATLVNHHVEPAVGPHKGRHARAVDARKSSVSVALGWASSRLSRRCRQTGSRWWAPA